ncbi:MAG TPA: Cache 3/Cache 2 fusion domain-containing protein, partial [Devosiaceae bacterium]
MKVRLGVPKWMSNIKLTTSIALMGLLGIVFTVAVVTLAGYFNLVSGTDKVIRDQEQTALRGAVSVLASSIAGTDVKWGENNTIESIVAWAVPPFMNHDMVDTIGRVTGEKAVLYAPDKDTKDLVARTTNIFKSKDERALDLTLPADGPVLKAVAEGKSFRLEQTILGVDYYGVYQPVLDHGNKLVGVLYVGVDKQGIDGVVNGTLTGMLMAAGIALLAAGAVILLFSRLLTRPIPRLVTVMQSIASGELETAVPYADRGNELGHMARAVEVFRDNSRRVVEMSSEAEQASEQRRIERAEMMQNLQRAFGEVVDAAASGDFTRRVSAEFSDAELNRLAEGVNTLVETVERGLSETG